MATATFASNIVYLNLSGGTRSQISGPGILDCIWRYSDIVDLTVLTMGNMNVDPTFVDVTRDNFHLKPGSPVKDKADIGADELP